MRQYDIPTIPEYRINLEDIEDTAKDAQYPLLVKPSDSSGARGITICHNLDELKQAIGVANGVSKIRMFLSNSILMLRNVLYSGFFLMANTILQCLGTDM